MIPMHRLATTLVRSPASAAASSTISRRAAIQAGSLRTYATGNGTDTTNASGQARDKAQVKNHSEAQQGHDKSAPLSEGVSLGPVISAWFWAEQSAGAPLAYLYLNADIFPMALSSHHSTPLTVPRATPASKILRLRKLRKPKRSATMATPSRALMPPT